MANQDLLNAKQATTIRRDGSVEFVTHNVSIQPDRSTFANFDEFNAYLGKTSRRAPRRKGHARFRVPQGHVLTECRQQHSAGYVRRSRARHHFVGDRLARHRWQDHRSQG